MKNLVERMFDFADKVEEYSDKHPRTMLDDFISYWTEHNEKGRKMRFEMSKNQPFHIGRRLGTWKRNNKNKGESQEMQNKAVNKLDKYG